MRRWVGETGVKPFQDQVLGKHDYPEPRIYVESQYFAWEFEAIKAEILDGTLVYQPKPLAEDAAA